MNRIRVIKNNESPWNYLVGVLRQTETGQLNSHPEVVEFSKGLYNAGNRSPYLLAFLIDLYQEQALQRNDNESAEKVYAMCNDMASKHDVIRRKYWQYVAAHLKSQLSKPSNPKQQQ